MKRIEDFDRFEDSDTQLEAIKANKLRSQNVRQINQERTEIAHTLKDTAEFTDEEKQSRFNELSEIIDDTDLTEVRAFKQRIGKEQQDVRKMIDDYTSIIETHKGEGIDGRAFGIDKTSGYDAAEDYIQQFMKQPLEEKKRWLSEIKEDIKDRIRLYRRAKELMPDQEEMIKGSSRHELRELLNKCEKYLEEAHMVFKDNPKLFSEAEQKRFLDRLSDATRSDQAKIVNQISQQLNERRETMEQYESLPTKYKKLAVGFEKMSFEERTTALDKIETAVTTEYRDTQRNHKYAKHISETGKDDAYNNHFKNAPLNKKFEALGMLDSQFEFEKKLSDKYEQLLTQLGEHESDSVIDRLRVDFYKAVYDKKKNELIPELEKRVEEAETNEDKEKEYDKQYSTMLEEAVQKKHISAKTRNLSMNIWKKESFKYKKEMLENNGKKFNDLMKPRIELFERFEVFPDSIREENKDFYESGMLRRMQIVTKLEADYGKTDSTEQAKTPETQEQKRIQELTLLAANAERQQRFEEALEHYEEILELDPNDLISSSRIDIILTRIQKESITDESITTDKPETSTTEDRLIAEAMRNQQLNEDRKHYTVMKASAEETQTSEDQHNKIKAAERQTDAEDKQIAEELEEHTDGEYVLDKKGEAEEIVEINIDKEMNEYEKSDLKNTIREDVIHSSERTAAKHIQFRDNKGQKLSAKTGMEKVKKMEEEMEDNVSSKVIDIAKRRRKNIDEEELKEKIEKQDFKVDIAA
jgi:hypothetical protein